MRFMVVFSLLPFLVGFGIFIQSIHSAIYRLTAPLGQQLGEGFSYTECILKCKLKCKEAAIDSVTKKCKCIEKEEANDDDSNFGNKIVEDKNEVLVVIDLISFKFICEKRFPL